MTSLFSGDSCEPLDEHWDGIPDTKRYDLELIVPRFFWPVRVCGNFFFAKNFGPQNFGMRGLFAQNQVSPCLRRPLTKFQRGLSFGGLRRRLRVKWAYVEPQTTSGWRDWALTLFSFENLPFHRVFPNTCFGEFRKMALKYRLLVRLRWSDSLRYTSRPDLSIYACFSSGIGELLLNEFVKCIFARQHSNGKLEWGLHLPRADLLCYWVVFAHLSVIT